MNMTITAQKIALALVLSGYTKVFADLAIKHYHCDASRPQQAGYKFWSDVRDRSLKSLLWLLNNGDIDQFVI